jgi:hypothetical protein
LVRFREINWYKNYLHYPDLYLLFELMYILKTFFMFKSL